MAQVRILVLSSSTGGGHDARAQAFAEWCRELYRQGVEVRIEQMLERSSTFFKWGVHLYNWIQQRAPWLHKPYFTLVETLALVNSSSVQWGRGYYEKVLRQFRPHLVFSVHDCLNRGYFQLAREILGAERVRCATYCGEFSGGFGYSVNWVEPTADLYIARTVAARDFAVKLGMPHARTRVRGHFMRPRAHRDILVPAARSVYLEQELGLSADRFTIFFATGTNGANNHLELLPKLLPYADRVQAIVICGRNAEAYNAVNRWRNEHPELDCYVDGYSDQVHLLLQVSQVIVTRGGTTTCAKALHFRCPIIFNAFGGIMPQENLTVKFFRDRGGAEMISTSTEFAAIIDQWMRNRWEYELRRQSFLSLRYDEDPTLVIRELVDLAQSAARTDLQPRPFHAMPLVASTSPFDLGG